MPNEHHEQARLLIDRRCVEGISSDDACWLDGHLTNCPECSAWARETERLLEGLAMLPCDSDPAMTGRVQEALVLQSRRKPWRRTAWLAAAATLLIAAPVYRVVQDRQRDDTERQDAALMQNVAARLSQTVPEALQPLQGPEENVQ